MNATEMRNPETMDLEHMPTEDIVRAMIKADRESVDAVERASEAIGRAIDAVTNCLEAGGRLIYVGAGTSGRIAVMDAAECPPTFGVEPELVSAVIAGGDRALKRASEGEEDDASHGRRDILEKNITEKDTVMGISASGGASYVAEALRAAKERGAVTISLANNPGTLIASVADIAIVCETGAEVLTGSTRLKAGNAQKMVLNMITTAAMVKTGKVVENMMINLRPTNKKLRARVIRITRELTGLNEDGATEALDRNAWDIRKTVESLK